MVSKKLITVILIVGILLVTYTNLSGYFVKTQSATETAIVGRVIDGDTVMLTNGERVRLIGIDADEKGEECYTEAKERMRELVEGKDVLLERDVTDKDKYGRLLRYIYVDDIFVNLVMVEEGMAKVYTIKPDIKYVEKFEDALRVARDGNGCIWRK